jgi:hypothetical protein
MKSVTAALLASAAFALSAVSLASAAELEWNQERVAALAQDLVKHLEVILADLEKRPHAPEQAAARAKLMGDLARLKPRARELAERLTSGAGRAETAALFREVEALGNQAAKDSHEYPAPFELNVPIDKVQTLTIQLARYYGDS